MNKAELNKIEIIKLYEELKSSYKVASFLNASATAVKRVLKDAGVLRTQKVAALERDNNYQGKYNRTKEQRKILSEIAKTRKGEKNTFFGKSHTDSSKQKMSESAKTRLGELNPNYKNGNYIRRPRDFKQAEFTKLRNQVFNRDNYTCKLTGIKGGNLHPHHLLPYWVCPDAFLDIENLITVSSKAHFELCHNSSWGSFNVELIPEGLLNKYSLDRERLSELASIWKKR